MLTPEQIAALRDAAGRIADPINEFLLRDIARRISEAGQLTSTASYQVWRAQQLGMSQREIKQELRRLLRVSHRELRRLLTQSAEVGYNFDIQRLPQVQSVPFQSNDVVQQMVRAAVELAQDDFTNLTQTLGLTDPYGKALPLQEAYRKTMDYAFQQVFTGATDYNTAIRQATKNLADLGVRVIDYKSGVHTSLEAAVRRNIMGGLGLLQEQITQYNHDTLGADGWEISAHANSAPDHEPIQGKQYSDAEYTALNNSLLRRIGTLNCGHAAFPIILGVSEPQYSEEQLRKFREDNAAGVDYQGKHYTGYEATQMQRKLERAIRKQKRRVLVDESAGDAERLQTDQIRLTRLNQKYYRFSKAAGLRTQNERVQATGFGFGQAARATAGAERHYQKWSKEIGINNSIESLAKYYDVKYNNPPEYELLQGYARGVRDGWISPNASFENYKALHGRIQTEVVGLTTASGTRITGQSEHFMQRVLGTMEDPLKGRPRAGVSVEEIRDALLNGTPRPIRESRTKGGGVVRSQKYVGKHCDVSVNPDSGRLIQCNPN